jgi:hypothetical protein
MVHSLKRFMEKVLISVSQMPDGEKLTGFSVMKGDSYKGDLMVVGRSVNGWIRGFYPSELKEEKSRSIILNNIIAGSQNDKHCPMLWVTETPQTAKDYNSNRSAFWRSIRNIVREFNLASVENKYWPSVLLWSNLFKVSPCEGGNPSSELRNIQLSACIELLMTEIELYKPKRILFLTGLGWCYPFLGSLSHAHFTDNWESYVSLCAVKKSEKNHMDYQIVVAEHPQTRNEIKWANEVKAAFEYLNSFQALG